MNTPLTLKPARMGPFDAGMARRQANRQGLVQVHMRAGTLAHVTQVSTWLGGWDALATRLEPLMPVPPATGRSAWSGSDWIVRTGPEELLVIAADGTGLLQQLREALSDDIGHSLDLSHARCLLRLQGEGAVPSLQKLFALDFREPGFAVGEARLSGSHHLPALLHRVALDTFDLYLNTSHARDQVESLFDAALEWGAELSLATP